MNFQFYGPSWYRWWPYLNYQEYNDDGHYGPTKFGKTYFCLGPFYFWWWTNKEENS